ncbi:MAG: gamma carbonic anhydrase family protein [Coriobacteriales bacterium]|jgi:carbonic anhydrase/acetyltransferase-like protein (isoleucine patch superfamily)
MFFSFDGRVPRVGSHVFVDESARVIGDVTLADGVTVLPGAVIRADDAPIHVGPGSVVEDCCVLHADRAPWGHPGAAAGAADGGGADDLAEAGGRDGAGDAEDAAEDTCAGVAPAGRRSEQARAAGLVVGARVTIGHAAVVHCARVGDDTLVGMGATLLSGAVIGAGSLIAAGALVSEGRRVPAGSLVMGVPGRVVRQVSPEQRDCIARAARFYREWGETAAARGLREVTPERL